MNERESALAFSTQLKAKKDVAPPPRPALPSPICGKGGPTKRRLGALKREMQTELSRPWNALRSRLSELRTG
jgi:hypothetical protein